MASKLCQKIIVNQENNLNKIYAIIKSNNPEVLILESENTLLNLKTNSIAYKLVTDENWVGIETKQIKRKRDEGLLKITLVNHQFVDKYYLRHENAGRN